MRTRIINNLEICMDDESKRQQSFFNKALTYNDALIYVDGLMFGWRLPTQDEFRNVLLPLHIMGIGNFKKFQSYWTGTLMWNSFDFYRQDRKDLPDWSIGVIRLVRNINDRIL